MQFARLSGPDGAPGASNAVLVLLWGVNGDASAPGFQLSSLSRVGEDGQQMSPRNGDWLIDSRPAIYRVVGGALQLATMLPAGATGPAGPPGGMDPHTHVVQATNTYAELAAGYPSTVTLTDQRYVR